MKPNTLNGEVRSYSAFARLELGGKTLELCEDYPPVIGVDEAQLLLMLAGENVRLAVELLEPRKLAGVGCTFAGV